MSFSSIPPTPSDKPKEEHAAKRGMLNGIAVSTGIAIGRTQFINRRISAQEVRYIIRPEDAEDEVARLESAVGSLVQELGEARDKLLQNPGKHRDQAEILDVYILICSDRKMLSAACATIRNNLFCAEWAWQSVENEITADFEKLDSDYLRERAADVRTVGTRVITRLRGQQSESKLAAGKHILLAHDLTPADTLALPPSSIIALVTEMGGQATHTGILARSMDIPCVVGVSGLEEMVPDKTLVIVDGIQGCLIINPTENELAEYNRIQAEYEAYQSGIRAFAMLPAETEDGTRITVSGNIEQSHEVEQVKAMGGEGVGLYRTEFGYISRRNLPTEEELYYDYAAAVSSMAPGQVVLRTLDTGADKNLPGLGALEEANPALGLRAVRYCLRHQGLFRTQLRAILRAGTHGNAALMLPLISGLNELKAVKSILDEVRQELDSEGLAFDKNMPVGAMIELPAAVLQAPFLAREVDFFSIGTNDLIQHTIGVDRSNKYVSHLYQPLHPAVIQSIRMVVDAAREAGISVSVCGEMASDPYCLPILLAMGVDTVSINPRSLPAVKHMVRNFDMDELHALLREACNSNSAHTTSRLVSHYVYSRFRNELNFFNSTTGRSA